jgi:hypothetical protein
MKTSYPVIEFRRYTLKPGSRAQFSRHFDTHFPEAFQQAGAIALGHFHDRDAPDSFTWIHGFRSWAGRAEANRAFYDGPVWQEHKHAANRCIADSDNVLLLRPLYPDSDIPVLRAVDPVAEPLGARGIVVAQLLRPAEGKLDACALAAECGFAAYRGHGVTEAGILVSIGEPNNFPRHPVRTDGPWLVWIGVLRDEAALDALRPAFDAAGARLLEEKLLAAPAELLVLDPCRRSRMRWLPATVTHTAMLAV